ncbi:MAG: archaellin/type IV pilin N-terminal domain-containing protein [Candidatus Pacearchaeota archaeon]|jgi:FlaG/FlaF family flagellin (archaellin)
MNKRGLSSVIATMLLITITIVIALIVFLWFRGIQEEAITKFDGVNVKVICDEVQFDADYSNGAMYIVNTGDVPIYKMEIKEVGEGYYETQTLENNWPELGLTQGGAFQGNYAPLGESYSIERIVLIPVLIGHTEQGDTIYTCDEKNGYEIIL